MSYYQLLQLLISAPLIVVAAWLLILLSPLIAANGAASVGVRSIDATLAYARVDTGQATQPRPEYIGKHIQPTG